MKQLPWDYSKSLVANMHAVRAYMHFPDDVDKRKLFEIYDIIVKATSTQSSLVLTPVQSSYLLENIFHKKGWTFAGDWQSSLKSGYYAGRIELRLWTSQALRSKLKKIPSESMVISSLAHEMEGEVSISSIREAYKRLNPVIHFWAAYVYMERFERPLNEAYFKDLLKIAGYFYERLPINSKISAFWFSKLQLNKIGISSLKSIPLPETDNHLNKLNADYQKRKIKSLRES